MFFNESVDYANEPKKLFQNDQRHSLQSNNDLLFKKNQNIIHHESVNNALLDIAFFFKYSETLRVIPFDITQPILTINTV